jgi:hypothetical protein
MRARNVAVGTKLRVKEDAPAKRYRGRIGAHMRHSQTGAKLSFGNEAQWFYWRELEEVTDA